jgi:hypothetical protein
MNQRANRNGCGSGSISAISPKPDEGLRLETEILAQLARIEAKLDAISQEKTVLDFYSIEDFAQRVNRSNFCVREWARLGRIHAAKRLSGRGKSQEWMVSHAELLRYLSHGLLPDARRHFDTKKETNHE